MCSCVVAFVVVVDNPLVAMVSGRVSNPVSRALGVRGAIWAQGRPSEFCTRPPSRIVLTFKEKSLMPVVAFLHSQSPFVGKREVRSEQITLQVAPQWNHILGALSGLRTCLSDTDEVMQAPCPSSMMCRRTALILRSSARFDVTSALSVLDAA